MQIHIHTHSHTHTLTHIHTHSYIHIHECTHSLTVYTLSHIHTHIFTHSHTHISTRQCVNTSPTLISHAYYPACNLCLSVSQVEHEEWWTHYRFYHERRRDLISDWSRDRRELLNRCKVIFAEAQVAHELEMAKAEHLSRQQELCTQLYTKVNTVVPGSRMYEAVLVYPGDKRYSRNSYCEDSRVLQMVWMVIKALCVANFRFVNSLSRK